MNLDTIGEVIAERELFFENDPSSKLVVRMGKPQPFPEGGGYYCPYEIHGFGNRRMFYAGGVDAFQAIELCFRIIGVDLASLERDNGQQIRWDAAPKGGWGFPFPKEFLNTKR